MAAVSSRQGLAGLFEGYTSRADINWPEQRVAFSDQTTQSAPMDPHQLHEMNSDVDHAGRGLVSTHPPRRNRVQNICCVGAGYVGGPTSAVIASQNPNVQVTVVDLDTKRIEAWKSDNLPIFEPGLLEQVQIARDGTPDHNANLSFSTDVDGAIAAADLVFISVNTPTKQQGRGAGRASETGYLESAVRKIAEVAETDKIIVEKSTVPVKTAELIREVLQATGKPNVQFDVLSNPEFLAEGTAINDLLRPDRILIGSLTTPSGLAASDALVDLYAAWVARDRIITTNLLSSELAKLAANALLAQRISSINSLSAICEQTGADIEEVAYAVGRDDRIGPKMLKASVGFGGSCFKKDILSLAYIAETLNLPEVAQYWTSVIDINEYQKDRFCRRIVKCLYGTLTNKKVAILGFAYKKNTGDTRETAAITIVEALLVEGAQISLYDPKVRPDQIMRDLHAASSDRYQTDEKVTLCTSAHAACHDANAVVILTEWDEFSNKGGAKPVEAPLANGHAGDRTDSPQADQDASVPLAAEARPCVDWAHVASIMRRPRYVFDGRNVVDAAGLERFGFRVESVGKASPSAFQDGHVAFGGRMGSC